MTKFFSFGLNILADIFYPKYCFGCKRAGSYLCKFCITQIQYSTKTICIVCHKFSDSGLTHLNCSKTHPYSANRLISILSYHDPIISEMIITGKYYFIPEVFTILGAITAQSIFDKQLHKQLSNFVICPIPLHIQRHRWRGFNQSIIAGKIIAQALNIPIINLLQRNKRTKTQKNLKANDRLINMSAAFSVNQPFNLKVPKNVLLIDDVTTTGSTFIEAAKVLKHHGAETVWCLSLTQD